MKLLLAASLALGLWVCLTLLLNRTGNQLANRLLLALVALMLLPPINVYVQMAFGTLDWCWVLTTNLTWLYGPLLLGFIQALRGAGLSPLWWCHLLPFGVTLAWRLSGLPVTAHWIATALITQMLVYLAISLVLTVRHRRTLTARVKTHQTAYFYWLLYVIAGVAGLMLVDVMLIVRYVWFEPMATWPWRYLVMLTSLYLHGMAFVCVYRPKLLLNDVRQSLEQVVSSVAPVKEPVLAPSTAEQLKRALQQLMETDKPYLDNDLSLASLALRLGVTTHQLSSLLNDSLQQNFYDYINRYRLDEALRLLRVDQGKPIVELAYDAGFNNKNTFYRLFKARTGLTPTQFRKRPLAEKASA